MNDRLPGNKHGVLVLGAESQGLGIIRQLGEAGIQSIVTDQDSVGIARASKYCRSFIRSPNYSDEEAYVEFLLDLADKRDLQDWTLFPTDDEQVKVLSRYREILGKKYRVWTQEWDRISILYSKDLFYKYVSSLGLNSPDTSQIESIEQLDDLDLNFPIIIKPSVKENFYRRFRQKAIECRNLHEIREVFRKSADITPPGQLLIQERIPGQGENQYSLAGLFKDGEPVFFITARRVRQHPMDFGHASTYVELSECDELVEPSLKLMRSTGYSGVCEIEFIKDPRTSEYRILEVNPRFWGWHTITRVCGVNLPVMLYNQIYESQHKIPDRCLKGNWIKTLTDLPVGISLVFKGKLPLMKFIKQHCGASENATFRLEDPLPFFAEWLLVPYLWFKRGY